MKLRSCFLFLLFPALFACTKENPIEEGVSRELAVNRKAELSDIIYTLDLDIPTNKTEPITGNMTIQFDWSGSSDLVLDFKEDSSKLKKVSLNYTFQKGHIIIPNSVLQKGANTISIEFSAGDLSLNRNDDFLYTLFVPDRASTAFPLFDQPDLKAKYKLSLTIPKNWVAIANGELASLDSSGVKASYFFEETEPLSTYLFSFVAGRFQVHTRERNGVTLTMLERETDSAKVDRNIQQIFDLHFQALDWLENYTGIEYPFQKFGFALIPSFQYGGMEHPGAILYNANSLLLEESYTQGQLLSRASVIAHETSHMWFGDLVTMEWFNDVWMKEVFANFMAAKIMNPAFPEINHDLRFLMAHYPSAYSVDRTAGANPIQQKLNNLKNAGQMYGAIIYQKAPIVMRHLETLVGYEIFRKSLQEYLTKYSFGNADWDDLVNIIDKNSPEDVKNWSEAWVKEPGMPIIGHTFSLENESVLKVEQNDSLSLRPQQITFLIKRQENDSTFKLFLGNKKSKISLPSKPDAIIPNPDGFSYGYFPLDDNEKNYLIQNAGTFEDPVLRGSNWINLHEGMLRGGIAPGELLNAIETSLPREEETQVTQYLLNRAGNIFWKFLTEPERVTQASILEAQLLQELINRESPREKAIFYRAYINIGITQDAIEKMRSWWDKSESIEGLPLSESDFINLAEELALRGVADSNEILETQLGRIKNPDRKARMEFVIPALSQSQSVRDAFFESLARPENREHEPWVLEGLSYLHHPLRAQNSLAYILPSLEMLEEIQKTGDIFFPSRWLGTTFSGHNSKAAADIVRKFISGHPDYPEKLREKILQSSDELFRSSESLEGTLPSEF